MASKKTTELEQIEKESDKETSEEETSEDIDDYDNDAQYVVVDPLFIELMIQHYKKQTNLYLGQAQKWIVAGSTLFTTAILIPFLRYKYPEKSILFWVEIVFGFILICYTVLKDIIDLTLYFIGNAYRTGTRKYIYKRDTLFKMIIFLHKKFNYYEGYTFNIKLVDSENSIILNEKIINLKKDGIKFLTEKGVVIKKKIFNSINESKFLELREVNAIEKEYNKRRDHVNKYFDKLILIIGGSVVTLVAVCFGNKKNKDSNWLMGIEAVISFLIFFLSISQVLTGWIFDYVAMKFLTGGCNRKRNTILAKYLKKNYSECFKEYEIKIITDYI